MYFKLNGDEYIRCEKRVNLFFFLRFSPSLKDSFLCIFDFIDYNISPRKKVFNKVLDILS